MPIDYRVDAARRMVHATGREALEWLGIAAPSDDPFR